MRLPFEERQSGIPFLARHVATTYQLVDRVDLLTVLGGAPQIVEQSLAAVGDGLAAQTDVDVVEKRVRHGVRHRLHRLRRVRHADARGAQRAAHLVPHSALEEPLAEGVLACVDRLADHVPHHSVHRREDVRFLSGLCPEAESLAHALAFLECRACRAHTGVGLRSTRREGSAHAVPLGHHAAHRPRRLRGLRPDVQALGVETFNIEEEIRREVDSERKVAERTRRHATPLQGLHRTETLVLGHDEAGVYSVEVVALVGSKRLVVRDPEPREVVRAAGRHVVHASLVRQQGVLELARSTFRTDPTKRCLACRLEQSATTRRQRAANDAARHERSGSGEEGDLRLHGRLERDACEVQKMPGSARREVHTALRLGLAHHGRGERLAEVAPRGVARVVASLIIRPHRLFEALHTDADRGLETAEERLRGAVENLLHAIVRRVASENDRDLFKTGLKKNLCRAVLVRIAERLDVRLDRGRHRGELIVGERIKGVGSLFVATGAELLADAVEAGVRLPALEQIAHVLRFLLVAEAHELRASVERALHPRSRGERVETVDHATDAEDVVENIAHACSIVLAVELLLELRERDLRGDVLGSRPALRDPAPPGVGVLPLVPFERDRARHGERDRHELAANGGGLRRIRSHREHAVAGIVAPKDLPPLLLKADPLLDLLLRHHGGLLAQTLAVEVRSFLDQDFVVERPRRRELLTGASLGLPRGSRPDLHGGNRRAFGRLSGRHHLGGSGRRGGRDGRSRLLLLTLTKGARKRGFARELLRNRRRGLYRRRGCRRLRDDGRHRSRLPLCRTRSSANRARRRDRWKRDGGRLCHAPEGITGRALLRLRALRSAS